MPAPHIVRERLKKRQQKQTFRRMKLLKTAAKLKKSLPSAPIRLEESDQPQQDNPPAISEHEQSPVESQPPKEIKKKRKVKIDKKGRPTLSSQINLILDKLDK
ncbi:hypothetical protein P9112_012701 [Eukaryota sp. TZLM1-RC]